MHDALACAALHRRGWLTFTVGGRSYACEPGTSEHVLLTRVFGPNGGQPIFLLCGQTALSNQAGARHLRAEYQQLARAYGDRPFALMLRVVDTDVYGTAVVVVVADVTAEAVRPIPEPQQPASALRPAGQPRDIGTTP